MTEKMEPVRHDPEERIRFHAGAEIDGEICVVGGLDALPAFEPYNRIYSYKPSREEPWVFTDVDTYIHTVISARFDESGPEFFVLASYEGDVWALGPPGSGFSEIIPGAGSMYDDARYGDILSINWVGNSVYAVGNACQVHRRTGRNGSWELISANILNEPFNILGVAGRSENDVYILRAPKSDNPNYDPADRRGQILHSSGGDWQVIWDGPESATAGPILLPDGDVAFGGLEGMILKGNRTTGFALVSRGGGDWPGIVSLAASNGQILAADGQLLMAGDVRTTIVETRLQPDRESSIYLSARGDSLLSVGYHDILRRTSMQWERIAFPGNDPINSDTDWANW